VSVAQRDRDGAAIVQDSMPWITATPLTDSKHATVCAVDQSIIVSVVYNELDLVFFVFFCSFCFLR